MEAMESRYLMAACAPLDSSLGDDVHIGSVDESATLLSLESGVGQVCTFIDRDADHDGFRFVSPGTAITLEAEGEIPLILEVYDASGTLVADSSGHPDDRPTNVALRNVPTEKGEQYFTIVHSTKGGRGAYQLTLSAQVASQPAADLDGDGAVGFRDFLILSTNFGKAADAVFSEGDIDRDHDVDFEDFLILADLFGATN